MRNLVLYIIFVLLIIAIAIGIGYIIHTNPVNLDSKDGTWVYRCENGYTLNYNICVKEIDVIDRKINYYCNDGYTLLNNGTCVKKEYSTNYTFNYTCPYGYEYNDKTLYYGTINYKDKCIKVSKTNFYKEYYCFGGELQGTKCVTKYERAMIEETSCLLGGVYDSFYNICKFAPYTLNFTCPFGTYAFSSYTGAKYCAYSPTITKKCPIGYTKEFNKCVSYSYSDAGYTIKCPIGYILTSDNIQPCVKVDTTVSNILIACPFGYTLENNLCVKDVYVNANYHYYCPTGYDEKNNKCYKYDTYYPELVFEEQ